MRRYRFVATRACQHMLDEADHIGRPQPTRINRRITKAMIEEPVGEPQRVIDRPRAKAAMLDQIGLEVRQQLRARLLRLSQRHRLRHADIEQMLREPAGQPIRPHRAHHHARHLASQMLGHVECQSRRTDALDTHHVTHFPQDRSVSVDRTGRVILRRKTLGERVQIWLDAGLQILRHDLRAPCCWSDEDYAEWDWRDHTANRAPSSTCGIIRIAAL